ncbi:hypothetical protein [uncultured Mediterranean phage uvDeep-CGR2-KM21-C368]|nr:hypothetical protein [uncultured Mediterranean phage uvDeep-CGR2-KM21-C368]
MPDILSKGILGENMLEWTCIEICEQCASGRISKEQAYKLLDRKQKKLDDLYKTKIRNTKG